MAESQTVGRVLVVDDELEVREALRRILQKENLEVVMAAEGNEALARFAADEFRLVITDLVMPGMNGLMLLHELRRLRPEVPVLIMTAYGGWDTYLDAMNSGAFNYVTKPIKREDLLRQVRGALGVPERDGEHAPSDETPGDHPAPDS